MSRIRFDAACGRRRDEEKYRRETRKRTIDDDRSVNNGETAVIFSAESQFQMPAIMLLARRIVHHSNR